MSLLPDNIDYNYLKHFIKVNTTRDAAKAIAIPGQPDTRLAKVEDELYNELCAQHDRAGLFVSAKADEINRRLRMCNLNIPLPQCYPHHGLVNDSNHHQPLTTACANYGRRAPVTTDTPAEIAMYDRRSGENTTQATTKICEIGARGSQMRR